MDIYRSTQGLKTLLLNNKPLIAAFAVGVGVGAIATHPEEVTNVKTRISDNKDVLFGTGFILSATWVVMLTLKQAELDTFLHKHGLLEEFYNKPVRV